MLLPLTLGARRGSKNFIVSLGSGSNESTSSMYDGCEPNINLIVKYHVKTKDAASKIGDEGQSIHKTARTTYEILLSRILNHMAEPML